MAQAARSIPSAEKDRVGLQRPPSGVTPSVKRPLGVRAPLVPLPAASAQAAAENEEALAAKGEGHPTVRELVAWHVGNPAGSAAPPAVPPPPAALSEALEVMEASSTAMPSGIRLTDAANEQNDGPISDGALSFQVYTLADLDARRPDADPALRMSRVMFEQTPRPPTAWLTVRDRGQELATATVGWLRLWAKTKSRPTTEPLRVPFELARAALATALRTVDWKKVSVYGGACLGTVLVLLAIVLTVADLTDDLKPARTARDPDAKSYLATDVVAGRAAAPVHGVAGTPKAAVPPTALAAAPAEPVAPAPAAPVAASPAIELDEEAPAATPAPATARAYPAARPRRPSVQPAGAKARGKLSFRDANEVFRP